jgi:hypothetical protein
MRAGRSVTTPVPTRRSLAAPRRSGPRTAGSRGPMPGNWRGPGRAQGRSGTTAGTAPRPDGCSRAGRRRTSVGRTGSGGRGICASQRRTAPMRATLLPPLGMSLSVMSGGSDRMSGCGRFGGGRCGRRWPPRTGPDTGFLRKRNQAPRDRRSYAWLRCLGARHAVSRGLRVRQVRRDALSASQRRIGRSLTGHVLACHAVRDHAHGSGWSSGGSAYHRT